MAPKKPTVVNVEALRTQLTALKQVQSAMANAGPADPTQVQSLGGLYEDLCTSDGLGLQGVVAQTADQRYTDCTTWIVKAHSDLVSGVDTLVTLLQSTIDKHGGADKNAADAANRTGAGGSGGNGASGGSTDSTALGGS